MMMIISKTTKRHLLSIFCGIKREWQEELSTEVKNDGRKLLSDEISRFC